MKRLVLLLILVVSRSSIAQRPATQRQETQRTETQKSAFLQGVVVQAGTGTPIANATVELTGIASNPTEFSSSEVPGRIAVSVTEVANDGSVFSLRTRTNRDGQFTISNIPPGTGYHVVATRWPQYLPTEHGQHVPALPGRPLAFSSGQEMRDLRIELMPAAVISGRILDSRGRGVETQIEVLRLGYPNGIRAFTSFQFIDGGRDRRPAMSEGNGKFRIEGLRPGLYYLYAAAAPDYPTLAAFHPDGLLESTARPIVLRMGENRSDIEIRVAKAEERQLRGKATFSVPGTTIQMLQVTASLAGALPYRSTTVTSNSNNSDFRLQIRGAGTYLLHARAVDARSRQTYWGSTTVEVQDKDLGDLVIPLTSGLDIRGRVLVEGDLAPDSKRALAEAFIALRPQFSGVSTPTSARFGMDSAFVMQGVPAGEYRAEVIPLFSEVPSLAVSEGLGRAFVKSLRMGEHDVLSNGFRLDTTSGRQIGELEVVISFSGGFLDGRILTEKGEPAAAVKAIVIPDNPQRNRSDLYRSVYTDDAGRFQLRGIPPGNYRLFAWEQVTEGAWRDPHMIRLYENRGTPIQITEGGYETADATLIPAGT